MMKVTPLSVTLTAEIVVDVMLKPITVQHVNAGKGEVNSVKQLAPLLQPSPPLKQQLLQQP